MKKILLLSFLLYGCQSITVPPSFTYEEIQTDTYRLASWQKITNSSQPVRIYIEGDGNAFNYAGQPTANPTPHGVFLRKIAFNDPNANVVYLARPCQFVNDMKCSEKDWTTGRFSSDIISAVTQAIKDISKQKPVVLIGYSGGALVSGVIAENNPDLRVKKWITLAGVLNHEKWTENLNLPPLTDSLDLKKMPCVPQIHFIGKKDKVVSYKLTESLADEKNIIIIPNATHDNGFNEYLPAIYEN